MTIPEVFAVTWERTHEIKACVAAVKSALRKSGEGRPAMALCSRDADVSWAAARRIIKAIAESSDLDAKDLTGHSRKAVVVVPRHVAMLMIRRVLAMSYPEIGMQFNGRHHTTVMSGCDAAEVFLATRPAVEERCRKLAEMACEPLPAESVAA